MTSLYFPFPQHDSVIDSGYFSSVFFKGFGNPDPYQHFKKFIQKLPLCLYFFIVGISSRVSLAKIHQFSRYDHWKILQASTSHANEYSWYTKRSFLYPSI